MSKPCANKNGWIWHQTNWFQLFIAFGGPPWALDLFWNSCHSTYICERAADIQTALLRLLYKIEDNRAMRRAFPNKRASIEMDPSSRCRRKTSHVQRSKRFVLAVPLRFKLRTEIVRICCYVPFQLCLSTTLWIQWHVPNGYRKAVEPNLFLLVNDINKSRGIAHMYRTACVIARDNSHTHTCDKITIFYFAHGVGHSFNYYDYYSY